MDATTGKPNKRKSAENTFKMDSRKVNKQETLADPN